MAGAEGQGFHIGRVRVPAREYSKTKQRPVWRGGHAGQGPGTTTTRAARGRERAGEGGMRRVWQHTSVAVSSRGRAPGNLTVVRLHQAGVPRPR